MRIYHVARDSNHKIVFDEKITSFNNSNSNSAKMIRETNLQEQIDEINAARIQEEVEREWRRREKEEALKRLEAQKILQKEREDQISNKRVMQAIEIERDRREFERIVRVQKSAFCREKKELEQKQQQALVHRTEILKQVRAIAFIFLIENYNAQFISRVQKVSMTSSLSRAGEREGARTHRRATKDVRTGSGNARGNRDAQGEAATGDGAKVPGDEGRSSAGRLHQRSETDDGKSLVNRSLGLEIDRLRFLKSLTKMTHGSTCSFISLFLELYTKFDCVRN